MRLQIFGDDPGPNDFDKKRLIVIALCG